MNRLQHTKIDQPQRPVIVLSVVNHGHDAYIRRMLLSFDRFLDGSGCDIRIVITQNLPDETIENYSSKFEIKTISNKTPLGFGANHNQAFASEVGDWFIVVNPDIWLDRPLVMSRLMETPERSLISAIVLHPSGRVADFHRSFVTPIEIWRRFWGRSTKVRGDGWFAAIFLAVPFRIYAELHGFDEDYFLYVEDCDLCWRAARIGVSTCVIPEWNICHAAQRQSHRSFQHFLWHSAGLIRFWRKLLAARIFERSRRNFEFEGNGDA